MFEKVLFGLIVLCGVVILACRYVFPQLAKREPEPWYLDYARSFFPVLVLVFMLRGFVAEPFRIPSGSMYPTLEIGDFILVNKYAYGIKLPILHTQILEVGEPKRGDIVVFRYPQDPSQNYIKRLIGLPGDTVEYYQGTVFVNGQKISPVKLGEYEYVDQKGQRIRGTEYEQTIAVDNSASASEVRFKTLALFSNHRSSAQRAWKVPEGQYFMMGDNRDSSADSRTWGFLPQENIVGKAFFVWMSWGNEDNPNGGGIDFERIGTRIQAETLSTGAE
ncbi:signal peptidase I [Arenicella chitinivorans]|uniref:Signal peptidase I n=1 Tax=Arenicella chitinivorans TaxID=1329800 RepID=A0A918RQG6_9GAMM|nr:signal peptidase I [Arenicella chitinivorans]GHA09053.1 signal peptidase I [Arenicella chitinivorans]